MADRLNDEMASGVSWSQFTLLVSRPDDTVIGLEFNPNLEDDIGFLPGTYIGRVLDGQTIEATGTATSRGVFADPYNVHRFSPRCYDHWEWIDGRLHASISRNDGMIAGTVEDTFRHPPTGGVFTVKTSFRTRP